MVAADEIPELNILGKMAPQNAIYSFNYKGNLPKIIINEL
jgi:hypothetical protein